VKKAGKRTVTLASKLQEKKAMTALQRSRWVEAGLEVFGLEGELERIEAEAAVRPLLRTSHRCRCRADCRREE